MRDVLIKIEGTAGVDYMFNKTILLNDKEVAKIMGDKYVIHNVPDDAAKLSLQIWGGFYSTECHIPASSKPQVIEFSPKRDNMFKLVLLLVVFLTVIEVVFIKALPVWTCYTLLFGTFFVWGCVDIIKRKNKFKVTITGLE